MVLVLGRGCTTEAPEPTPPPQAMAMMAPAPPPPVLRPIEPPLPASALPPQVVMAPAVPEVQAPPTDAVSLRMRYGAPNFIRREAETELWRYDGTDCAAFFFLYREGGVLKLRYSETMPRGMTNATDPVCVESLTAHSGARAP
jgi:hypothetical protein